MILQLGEPQTRFAGLRPARLLSSCLPPPSRRFGVGRQSGRMEYIFYTLTVYAIYRMVLDGGRGALRFR